MTDEIRQSNKFVNNLETISFLDKKDKINRYVNFIYNCIEYII